jgi:ABC-type multidrug transport system ATPase subunit
MVGSPASVVSAEHLSKTYGSDRGVVDHHIEVEAGEVFG